MVKKTAPKGIGTINSPLEFVDLVQQVATIIREAFEFAPNTPSAINRVKTEIDNLVGRSRSSFTKTDVYQVSFLMFFPIVKRIQNINNVTFKETQVNTLVAKLMTEGRYGNPSVVRRQTTSAKLLELQNRLYPGVDLTESTVNFLSGAQFTALKGIAQTILVRGTQSTSTQRVSNRTRRTTTPTTTTPRTTTRRTTTPAVPVAPAATQVTQTAGEPSRVQVSDIENTTVLLVALRETIKRFGETNDEKAKLRFIIDAWRFAAIIELKAALTLGIVNIEKETFRKITSRVITRIGDVYNPANDQKYKSALKYLGYVVYLLCSGKIRTAQFFSSLILRNQSRQQVSAEIFRLGIGRTSAAVFNNFYLFQTGGRRIAMIIDGIFQPSFARRIRVQELLDIISRGTTSLTTTVTEIQVPGYTVPETTPASTRQVVDNNPRSTTPPEASVTPSLIREIPFTGTVGIEIEYYGVPKRILEDKLTAGGVNARQTGYTHAVTPYWKLTEDSSAEGRYAGEMVSPILKGKAGLVEMRKCINLCQEAGMLVNKSGGFHVHFGMQGVSVQSIVNIITNYNNLQPIINKMLHRWRRGTQWGKEFSTSQINALQRATTMNDVYNAIAETNRSSGGWNYEDNRNSSRYYAINVFCYLAYGTIEFRQYTSVLESDTVLMWTYFLHFLIEVSKKKQLTRYDWTNVENFLPKKVATFWANRIYELGEGSDRIVDDFTSRETT
jgi:hypothetical protein